MQNLSKYCLQYNLPIDLTIVGENKTLKHNLYFRKCIHCAKASENSFLTIFLHQNILPIHIPSFYYSTDLFVMYSYSEPASFSQIPAIALGIPVLINCDNGTSNYISSHSNGFLLSDTSYSSLEKSLNSFFSINLSPDSIRSSYLSIKYKAQQTLDSIL